ncbi:MAG: CcmD family protein [Bacteroidota bacterium]
MYKMKSLFTVLLFVLFSATVTAQEVSNSAETVFTSNGKLGVVVAVVITILIGIFLYLISLDKKISRLEKNK